MIEIIREEELDRKDKRALPKDIKQIGTPDVGERIYLEHRVYEFLHPYGSEREKTAYVLLGRFENYAGRQCVFVEAAICLEEVEFENGLPGWNDQTWGYIYRQLKKEHDSMVIIGWALDIKGQLPNMTSQLERMHQEHFGGVHQILFLMDSLECEEAFYGNRNGHLYRREGFYIYYDRQPQTDEDFVSEQPRIEQQRCNIEQGERSLRMKAFGQERMAEEEQPLEYEQYRQNRKGSYRKQMHQEPEEKRSYASALLVLAFVGVLGGVAYNNQQKVNEMEAVLAQLNQQQFQEVAATAEQEETEAALKIETVAGNVEKQSGENVLQESEADSQAETFLQNETSDIEGAGSVESASSIEEISGQNGADLPESISESGETTTQQSVQTTAEPTAQTYLEQGYYIVQKGDNLAGICRKIYQTTAIMDKLCEINGIEDEDAIYAGQRLTLPN
jgi:LysM repeat protein